MSAQHVPVRTIGAPSQLAMKQARRVIVDLHDSKKKTGAAKHRHAIVFRNLDLCRYQNRALMGPTL